MASWNGNVELVRTLIQLGLDVNESQVVSIYLLRQYL